jgi:hypothetical protein
MGRKPPIMQGSRPIKEYDLDNPSVLKLLNVPFQSNNPHPPKISDRYVVYGNDKRAIVENKSSSLHKAVEQLESTANLLIDSGNRVDYMIIVADEINRIERRFYKQEPRTYKLVDPSIKNKPYLITVRSHTWEVLIFYESQVDNMYHWIPKNLVGGS